MKSNLQETQRKESNCYTVLSVTQLPDVHSSFLIHFSELSQRFCTVKILLYTPNILDGLVWHPPHLQKMLQYVMYANSTLTYLYISI